MKQALLITAYKDFKSLAQLIKQFDSNFNIYIHIDKKSSIDRAMLKDLSSLHNVKHVETKYKVNWGSLNHLKSYLSLCSKALEDQENKFFHIITGEDYPIQCKEEINKKLHALDQEKGYLEYFEMPSTEWEGGGMSRLEHYNLFDFFNAKTKAGKKAIHLLQRIQFKFNFKRTIEFKQQLFGGSTYWSLPRNMLDYVIRYTNGNPHFLKRFNYTFCAEEIYFQTLLMNSKHAPNIVNDNLRFIDFESGKGGYPAFLDEDDFQNICRSNKLFARKIKSVKLKEMLSNKFTRK